VVGGDVVVVTLTGVVVLVVGPVVVDSSDVS
jgi:hypothetical protein